MAVDTPNKRASCLSFNAHRGRVGPTPDGSLGIQKDRQQLGLTYPGILAAAPGLGGLTAGMRLMLLGAG
jgi:hypothetical protein